MTSFSHTLSGKGALITGSNDGLGLCMAESLASAGCRVVIHGLIAEETMLEKIVELRARYGVEIFYVQCDLLPKNDDDPVAFLINRAEHFLGRIDILVNNAVVRHFSAIEHLPLRQWHESLAINLTASFRASQLVIPIMRAQKWGRIFNMTSVYGSRAAANRVDYVTTKTALLGLTRSIALECISDGITCNALCPGSVLTPNINERIGALMQDQKLDREAAVKVFLQGKQPSGKLVDASAVGDMIVFLSGPAGSQITGAMMPIEGGWLST